MSDTLCQILKHNYTQFIKKIVLWFTRHSWRSREIKSFTDRIYSGLAKIILFTATENSLEYKSPISSGSWLNSLMANTGKQSYFCRFSCMWSLTVHPTLSASLDRHWDITQSDAGPVTRSIPGRHSMTICSPLSAFITRGVVTLRA